MSQPPEDHTRWHELLAGHALNALDPDEEAELLEHLAECPQCRAELDEHALTAAHLAALADDDSDTAPAWSAIRAGVLGESATVASLEGRRRPARQSQRVLAAAAAIVVAAGASVAGWQVFGSTGGAPRTAVAAACANVSPCSAIVLRSSDGVRRATLVVTGGVARLQAVAMGPAGDGRTYVLWQLPRGRAPVPLAEFVSASGSSASSPLAVPLSQTTAFAVSSERADVHPISPTRVVAIGSV